MTPITLDHFAEKLEDLKRQMDAGALRSGEYDQRLARLIQELRERKIDADRAQIHARLVGLLANGVITRSVQDHLVKRLDL